MTIRSLSRLPPGGRNVARMSLALASALLAACGILTAQPAPNESAPSLLANVLDRQGMAVRDLTKESFQVKVNGRQARLLEASYSLAPRRIVVVLDMSGSMAGGMEHKKWKIAHEALEDLLTESPPDISIALLTFSDQVHDAFDFSQNRSSMALWLKEGADQHGDSRIRGRTALFDAMLAAKKLLGTSRPGDAIYAITDGGDNSSHISALATRKLLLESGIRLFVFLFAEPSLFEGTQSGTESIKELARASGGFVFGVSAHPGGVDFLPSWDGYDYTERTRQTIKLYTRALNIQVNGFYTLRFDSPVIAAKARKVSLDIVDAARKPRKDVAFTYSTMLLPQSK
jgi:von Willebrand factor type A domain